MSKPQFCQSLSFHSFGPGDKQVCLSKNDEFCAIYDTNGKPDDTTAWKLSCNLSEDEKAEATTLKPLHPGYVSGIDWCQETNCIVTCGHDRNAYVWKQQDNGTWKPNLVILRIMRAATGVKWSPDGKKFAVTSGAKCVPVCHFEESQNWWISKMIKKHRSTVLTLDWSPNSKFVVTGGCDFKCRVFSAFIENIDEPDNTGYEMWDKANEFGECLAEFDQAKAWVQGVSWAPSGFQVAFVGHGSTLHVANLKDSSVANYYSKALPFHDVQFIGDGKLVVVGFDCNPTIFEFDGDNFKEPKQLDPCTDSEEKKKSGSAAMNRFKQADSKGTENNSAKPITTFHKNCIRDVEIHSEGGKRVRITTAGLDGRLLTWKW